jgi:DNA-binding response OmpR family regulator
MAPVPFDVVLLDLRLPDASGLAVLAQAATIGETQVILMTARHARRSSRRPGPGAFEWCPNHWRWLS